MSVKIGNVCYAPACPAYLIVAFGKACSGRAMRSGAGLPEACLGFWRVYTVAPE